VKVGDPEVRVKQVYEKMCKETYSLLKTPYYDGFVFLRVDCRTRDPWPFELEDPECEPPVSPEPTDLTDRDKPPSGIGCLKVEVGDFAEVYDFSCAQPILSRLQTCATIAVAGHYPITRTMQYTDWEWETTTCERDYVYDDEILEISYTYQDGHHPFAEPVQVMFVPQAQ